MKLSLRIFSVYFLLVGLGLFTYFHNAANQLRPLIRQSAENAMVDSANLLAEIVAEDIYNQRFEVDKFAQIIARYRTRQLHALIWDVQKLVPDMTCYITDKHGRVIFHSDPDEIGKDYSRWLDVSKTLKGEYGARTTRQDPEDELTSVMYVAAPIYYHQELLGVFTVIQPNASSLPFLEFARQQLITQGSLILIFALLLGGLMSYWLTHSVRRLADYVQRVRKGERVALPKLYERELASLADATEAMRRELEGKAYIENYVHSLTHEMKSPLAGIRGAAELIDEGAMEVAEQHKFLRNIINSSHRMQNLIDRLLALAALENTYELANREPLSLAHLIGLEVAAKSSHAQQKNIRIEVAATTETLGVIKGDAFLLGQALSNLLDNALNFAARDSCIRIQLARQGSVQCISICNQGGWIPDYALTRIFERFYSLARPDGAGKSSGLGLSFVKEVVDLHAGSIELLNLGGESEPQVVARLHLPE